MSHTQIDQINEFEGKCANLSTTKSEARATFGLIAEDSDQRRGDSISYLTSKQDASSFVAVKLDGLGTRQIHQQVGEPM